MRREVDTYGNPQFSALEQKIAKTKAHEIGQSAMLYPQKEMPKDF
jgi:hypothetical protein